MGVEQTIEIGNTWILRSLGEMAPQQVAWLDKLLDSAALARGRIDPSNLELHVAFRNNIIRLIERGCITVLGDTAGNCLGIRVNPGVDDLPVY